MTTTQLHTPDLFAGLRAPAVPEPARRKRSKPIARGYAAPPGTGPAGETCKTCKYICRNHMSKNYYKCGLIRHLWRGSKRTDVLLRSPACKKWEPDTPTGVLEKRADDIPKQAPGFSRPTADH